jgi:hypothetical protein
MVAVGGGWVDGWRLVAVGEWAGQDDFKRLVGVCLDGCMQCWGLRSRVGDYCVMAVMAHLRRVGVAVKGQVEEAEGVTQGGVGGGQLGGHLGGWIGRVGGFG